jgi:competence protein ComGF
MNYFQRFILASMVFSPVILSVTSVQAENWENWVYIAYDFHHGTSDFGFSTIRLYLNPNTIQKQENKARAEILILIISESGSKTLTINETQEFQCKNNMTRIVLRDGQEYSDSWRLIKTNFDITLKKAVCDGKIYKLQGPYAP